MTVAVLNRQRQHRVDTAALRRATVVLLDALGEGAADVTVTLVSDRRMRALNREFRGQDRPTDVLSFAMSEGAAELPACPDAPRVLGDVVISTETALREVELHVAPGNSEADSLLREVIFLLIHGALHLVGHTHDTEADTDRMEVEAERLWDVLATAGVIPVAASA